MFSGSFSEGPFQRLRYCSSWNQTAWNHISICPPGSGFGECGFEFRSNYIKYQYRKQKFNMIGFEREIKRLTVHLYVKFLPYFSTFVDRNQYIYSAKFQKCSKKNLNQVRHFLRESSFFLEILLFYFRETFFAFFAKYRTRIHIFGWIRTPQKKPGIRNKTLLSALQIPVQDRTIILVNIYSSGLLLFSILFNSSSFIILLHSSHIKY